MLSSRQPVTGAAVAGEVGVVQMGFETNVPALGRFTSVDPVAGANAYDYAFQDPLNTYDLAVIVLNKGKSRYYVGYHKYVIPVQDMQIGAESYKNAVGAVAVILAKHDLARIGNNHAGFPENEYEGEAREVVRRILGVGELTAEQTRQLVYDVLIDAFSEDDIDGPDKLFALSDEIRAVVSSL